MKIENEVQPTSGHAPLPTANKGACPIANSQFKKIMNNLEQNIQKLNENIIELNKTISLMLSGKNIVSNNTGEGFSVEILREALLVPEVQKLLTEIVNYNQFHGRPMLKSTQIEIKPPKSPENQQLQPPKSSENEQLEPPKPEEIKVPEPIPEPEEPLSGDIVDTLYTVKSPKAGYFLRTKNIKEELISQYQIDVFGDKGEFYIPQGVDVSRFLLNVKKFIEPACNYSDDNLKIKIDEFDRIETIKKGIVEKDEKGWKIIKKASIRVIKKDK